MLTIREIALSRLLNLEIPVLYEEIIGIVEEHDLEAMRLHDIFELIIKQRPLAKTISGPYGKHPYTYKLARLHKKRLDYASLINMNVKAMGKIDDDETRRLALIASKLPKKYLTYLGQMSHGMVNGRICMFFSFLDNDDYAEVLEAFFTLGLQPYMDVLKKTNAEYLQLHYERKRDIEERRPSADPVVRRESLRMLRLFFEQITSNQRLYKEIDYDPLINELNLLLATYTKNIKTRIATNKRRAKKKAAAQKAASKETELLKITSRKVDDDNVANNKGEGSSYATK